MSGKWINARHSAFLALTAGAIVGFAQAATAQTEQPQRLVDYVDRSCLRTNSSPGAVSAPNLFSAGHTNQVIASAPKRETAGDRWEKFEAEFGIKEKDPSFVKSSMESAKYKLDETVFAAKEFVEGLRYDVYLKDFLKGSGSDTGPRRYYSDPIRDSFENAQIKSGVDWNENIGGAFIGVRLVLPLGD